MYRFYKQTPRLTLRELRPEDAPALFLLNADPEVTRYTGDVPFASVEQVRGPVQCHGAESTLYALSGEAWSQHPLAFARA